MELLRPLGLRTPAVLMTGTMIYDVAHTRCLAATPLARETADDGGYATLSELLILSKRQLSLEDLRSAVFRFAAFAEGPQADVRHVRKAVHTLTQLVEPLRGFYGERPGMVRKRAFCGLRGAAAVSRLAGLHAQAGGLALPRAHGRGLDDASCRRVVSAG